MPQALILAIRQRMWPATLMKRPALPLFPTIAALVAVSLTVIAAELRVPNRAPLPNEVG